MNSIHYILMAVAGTLLIVGVTVPVGCMLLKRVLRESRHSNDRDA